MSRALGIDLGEARIGLAISDELGMLAHPLETVRVRETRDVLSHIARIVVRDEVNVVVVGLPRNMDGSYGPAAETARAFADRLRTKISAEIVLWDERLTSVAAQRALHEAGLNTKKSRPILDQVAAQLILQGYLDRWQAQSAPPP
jgi:putative Holliday junction resolvase